MKKTDPTLPGNANSLDPAEARAPCILLLDVSAAMAGLRIRELCAGLAVYRKALATDSVATRKVEVAVVAFGGKVQTLCDFTLAGEFRAPQLIAGGDTPLGAALHHGLDLVQDRKHIYWTYRVPYYRPWVFLISGSTPTDLWRSAADRVRHGEANKAFSLFAVGSEGANFDTLRRFTTREPLRLKGLRYQDLFLWLSESQRAVARSTMGDRVTLHNPATAEGWAASGLGSLQPKEPQG